jgi:histidine kinase
VLTPEVFHRHQMLKHLTRERLQAGGVVTSREVNTTQDQEHACPLANENYRAIFDNIPNPVFILDRKNLRILDCNQSVKEVYGYNKEELLQSSFLNFFDEGEHQNYALELRNASILNHVRQVTRDGRSIFVNIRVSPYEHLGRKALLVTSSDVIRIMVIKQQLTQASKMATLGEMATGIAHELNQPLSVIKTASSFLLNWLRKGQRPTDAVLRTMLEEIDGHVDRASGIINHIRQFGRKSESVRQPLQVNQVLQRALEIFSQQLRLREIEVVRLLADDLPPILADPNRLEQVFINLLINARDAIEEKHERFPRSEAVHKIEVLTGRQQDLVTIEIRDTGIGVPASLVDKIFEPFFTTKPMGKGTGLGLSISYGIVQEFQGTLRVETVENEGSSFIIQFPAQVQSNG